MILERLVLMYMRMAVLGSAVRVGMLVLQMIMVVGVVWVTMRHIAMVVRMSVALSVCVLLGGHGVFPFRRRASDPVGEVGCRFGDVGELLVRRVRR